MKLFVCASCQQVVYFENSQCTRCGHALAYLPERGVLAAIEPVGEDSGVFRALAAGAEDERYRHCGNRIDHAACNWAVSEADDHRFCRACRLNDVIPNLGDAQAKDRWLKVEESKRRTLYTLLRLGSSRRATRGGPGGAGDRLRVQAGHAGRGEGHDRPRGRPDHDQRRRGRHAVSREDARWSWAKPTAPCSATFATRSGTTTGIGSSRTAPRLAAFREALRRRARPYDEAVAAHYREGAPARLACALRELVRVDAPVGRLGRELGALPAHGGHAGDGA